MPQPRTERVIAASGFFDVEAALAAEQEELEAARAAEEEELVAVAAAELPPTRRRRINFPPRTDHGAATGSPETLNPRERTGKCID